MNNIKNGLVESAFEIDPASGIGSHDQKHKANE